jgi:16S rRNA (guanine527-N7)-methyltransferase
MKSVSRETSPSIGRYVELLSAWNRRINLVGRQADIAFIDLLLREAIFVADLGSQIPGSWVDLGSGGGLPGIPVAILRHEQKSPFELIDADTRKCVFLRTVVRDLSLTAAVTSGRIELAMPRQASIVSAKALAPLEQLLSYVDRHLASTGTALLLKGEKHQEEIDRAKYTWHFDHDVIRWEGPSVVLKVRNIRRVD